MKRVVPILLLTTALAGCGLRTYTHDRYDASGRLSEHYTVTVINNAYDAKANAASLKLPDGATLDLTSPSGQADPNAIAALQSFGQALLAIGAAAAKVAGVLP